MPLKSISAGRFRSTLQALGPLLLAVFACGFVYEQIGESRDSKGFPQVGRSFDIGGRSLNLYCSGEGTPTVILESNWGEPGYSWNLVQRHIAKFTRACWYDRAGYGWSDAGPFPNHSDSTARDLHKLLGAAGVRPPYVLVGHAMGGFHVRVFRGFYPDDVAGLVLVDPMNEDMTIHIHNHIEALRPVVLLLHRTAGAMGVFRFLARALGPPPVGWTPREWSTRAALRLQPKSVVASGKEPPLWVNGELARASGAFGHIPVMVLSAGVQDQEEDPKLDHDHAWKLALHARLARLSTDGTQVVVTGSGPQIPWQAPEAVIAAVRQVVEKARANRVRNQNLGRVETRAGTQSFARLERSSQACRSWRPTIRAARWLIRSATLPSRVGRSSGSMSTGGSASERWF